MTRKNRVFSRGWIFILCFFPFILKAANPAFGFKLAHAINTGQSSLNQGIVYASYKNHIYYCTNSSVLKATHQLRIYAAEIISGDTNSFLLDLPDKVELDQLPRSIAISDHYVVFIDDQNFKPFLYRRTDSGYQFEKQIKEFGLRFQEVQVLSDTVFLLTDYYNHHPADGQTNVSIALFNAETKKAIGVIHPDVPCVAFTHFQGRLINARTNCIAIADPCGYLVRLFDTHLLCMDSISYSPANGWTNLEDNVIPFETSPAKVNPKQTIFKLQSLRDSISRIEQVLFLDDTLLIVISRTAQCGENSRRVDVWNINKHAILISSDEHVPVCFNDETGIDLQHMPLTPASTSKCLSAQGKLIGVMEEDYLPLGRMTFQEFQKSKNIYYEKSDPVYSIHVLDFLPFR